MNTSQGFVSFLKRAIAKFGQTYYYDKDTYVKMKIKMDIYCPTHGLFQQVPSQHLKGKGCPYCTTERVANEQRASKQQFIEKAQLVHGTKYDYSLVDYKTAKLPVTIICPIHGPFEQTPVKHTSYGCGCSQCAHYGINYTLPAVLYYLSYTDPNTQIIYYKIGITSKSVKERFFQCELQHMKIIFELPFNTAKEAYSLERQIIKHFSNDRYIGPKLIHRGSTEFFTNNVLDLPNGASLEEVKQALATLKD